MQCISLECRSYKLDRREEKKGSGNVHILCAGFRVCCIILRGFQVCLFLSRTEQEGHSYKALNGSRVY